MQNTTNVLLMVVIILSCALIFDKESNKQLHAQAASSGPIIFTAEPSKPGMFYIVNVDKSIVLVYEYNTSRGISLLAARQFDYDSQMVGTSPNMGSTGWDYQKTKQYIEAMANRNNK